MTERCRDEEASESQLSWVSPETAMIAEQVDARIVVRAVANTRNLTHIDPEAPARSNSAPPANNGSVSWNALPRVNIAGRGTQFPCTAYAQEADMTLRDYEDFVYGATYADQPDPVACWQQVHDKQEELVDWLGKGKDRVEVRGPNVDLTLSIAGRTFINSDGKRNMPSGEIFTGPVEDRSMAGSASPIRPFAADAR